jgi:hypothetical protein
MRLYLSINVNQFCGGGVKKTGPVFSIWQTLSFIIPCLTCIYAPQSVMAEGIIATPATISAEDLQPDSGYVPKNSAANSPALNIIAPPARPPLPPPPETPQSGQSLVEQPDAQASMPQAWRIKALQLFKTNNSLDKASVLAIRLPISYPHAFEAIAKALASSGITLEALSFSSGHMLLSCPNERGLSDKAIIALRQAAPDSDSSANSSTDIRVFCEARNHSLTLTQVKAILSHIQSSIDSVKNKTGAESL